MAVRIHADNANLIVGPGRPDTPATTGGIITGSEPVGAEYRSTDGAGVGAWMWMKQGTKWVVTDGDTGSRHLDVSATWPEYPEGTKLEIRRVNSVVTIRPGRSGSSGTTQWDMGVANPGTGFLELPTGFGLGGSPVITDIYSSLDTDFGTKVGSAMAKFWYVGAHIFLRHDAAQQVSFELRWTTSGWPTTLPGTPS